MFVICKKALCYCFVYMFVMIMLLACNETHKREADFSVGDINTIDSIGLYENSQVVVLKKQDNQWMYNDKQVNSQSISTLLATLNHIRTKAAAPKRLTDSIHGIMQSAGKRVEVFCNGKLFRTFTIAGTTPDGAANYIVSPFDEKPYMVYIPGVSQSVVDVFTADVAYWLDNVVLSAHVQDIVSVQVLYHQKNEQSFEIQKTANGYNFISLVDKKTYSNIDTVGVLKYLSLFRRVEHDGIVSQSVSNLLPQHTITLTTTNGKKQVLATYLKPSDNDVNTADVYKIYGVSNDNNKTLLITYLQLDFLLKKKTYFGVK